jgi:hypothetical protein
MDRILPAPIHEGLTSDTWGADGVRPRDIHNGIEDPKWSYWGGKPVVGPDGRYHWFGCRWPEDNPKGHMGWPESVMVRAISDKPTGPFVFENEIGPGHFPEITRLPDGSWALFHFHGYYHSDSLEGPWTPVSKEDAGFPGMQMGSVAVREDGSLLMVSRNMRILVKEKGASSFTLVSEEKVIPRQMPGSYEDPVIWRTEVQYHMIINDWEGRIAYHLRSKDGIQWKEDPGEAYAIGIDRYTDGTKVDWFKYERPKVLQDQYGRPTHLCLAVIDVMKDEDLPCDNHSSKNIVLPLVVERRVQILDEDPITSDAGKIRVKVAAEDGFDPQADVDVQSLRFGASEEVDYGRGCAIRSTENDGDDLVLVFDGEGHGITESNFAAKLLGTTTDGELLIGYARVPEYGGRCTLS